MFDNKILHREIKYLNEEKTIFKVKFIKKRKRYKKMRFMEYLNN